jgi:hypothetical protein
VIFVPDQETRAKLVSAGAKPGCVYTHRELAVLLSHEVSGDELRKLHEIKREFDGTITS